MVAVNYGISAMYGSASTTQSVAASSNSPASVSINLTGLAPATTYHARIEATNGDGASSTSDFTFTTASPLSTATTVAGLSGATASVTVACNGGVGGQSCSGPVTLTSHVTSSGKTVLAVAASAARGGNRKRKPKTVVTDETVGSGSYTVASGAKATVALKLNATGLKLLADLYKLPVTVTLGGATPSSSTATFSYPVISTKIRYSFSSRGGALLIRNLNFIGKPPTGARLTVVCGKGACSPRKRTIPLSHGRIALAPGVKVVSLPLGAVAYFELTASGDVGRVLVLDNAGSGRLVASKLCLPPGLKSPSRCA
jgi:hypothetical protein